MWNRKNQEDQKEIATHRYERQREYLSKIDTSFRITIKKKMVSKLT